MATHDTMKKHAKTMVNQVSISGPPRQLPWIQQVNRTILMAGGSYLLGSIPFSYLVARAHGVDLRNVGSGNVGSANAWRACGPKAFALALAGDLLKGAGLPFVALHLYRLPPLSVIVIGGAAMLGHTFPIFMRFRGGKAVATGAGVLLVVFPEALVLGACVWGTTLALTRIASVSSMVAVGAVAATTLVRWKQQRIHPVYASFILAAIAGIIYLHRSNIQRLLKGREHRFQSFR